MSKLMIRLFFIACITLACVLLFMRISRGDDGALTPLSIDRERGTVTYRITDINAAIENHNELVEALTAILTQLRGMECKSAAI